MSKICLGTVQFGLDYGINNKRGKIPKTEVFQILDYALANGIDTLDTAFNYGDSEKVIGEYIKKSGRSFKIISKLPKSTPAKVDKLLNQTLINLGINSLYGYLFHDFNSIKKNSKLLDKLLKIKTTGKISKIGFSIYYPTEIEYLLDNNIEFDIIQIPYNIFDQRFADYFPILKKKNIEIYARSVYLQGLLFKKPEDLAGIFKKIKPQILLLNELAQNLKLNLSSICLNFVLLNKNIDKVIIGVDNLFNLKENLASLKDVEKVKSIYIKLLGLKVNDEKITVPLNWN